MGIDTFNPSLTWTAESDRNGAYQQSYRVIVWSERESGSHYVVWDSGEQASRMMSVIPDGTKLLPRTKYYWRVEITDDRGIKSSAESKFETGIMYFPAGWHDAKRIIAPGGELFAAYTDKFIINSEIEIKHGSRTAGIVFCAAPPEYSAPHLNKYGIVGESFCLCSLIFDSNGEISRIEIYRIGYTPLDTADIPIDVLTVQNISGKRSFILEMSYNKGILQITVDGSLCVKINDGKPEINLFSPDFGERIPGLCSVGFYAGPGDTAFFNSLLINEAACFTSEDQGVFSESAKKGLLGVTNGKLRVFGGSKGKIVYEDPSYGGPALFRTEIRSEDGIGGKCIASARMYCACSMPYDLYCNGERVTNVPDSSCCGCNRYRIYDLDKYANGSSEFACGILTSSRNSADGSPAELLAMIVVIYSDGTQNISVSSPETYECSCLEPYMFTTADKGVDKLDGFSIPGYYDDTFLPSIISDHQEFPSECSTLIGIAEKSLSPKRVIEKRAGVFIMDFGQIVYGGFRIDIEDSHEANVYIRASSREADPKATTEIPIFDYSPIRRFWHKPGKAIFESRFFTEPFRYLEITASSSASCVSAEAVPYVLREPSFSLVSSEKEINKICKSIQRAAMSFDITELLIDGTSALYDFNLFSSVAALTDAEAMCKETFAADGSEFLMCYVCMTLYQKTLNSTALNQAVKYADIVCRNSEEIIARAAHEKNLERKTVFCICAVFLALKASEKAYLASGKYDKAENAEKIKCICKLEFDKKASFILQSLNSCPDTDLAEQCAAMFVSGVFQNEPSTGGIILKTYKSDTLNGKYSCHIPASLIKLGMPPADILNEIMLSFENRMIYTHAQDNEKNQEYCLASIAGTYIANTLIGMNIIPHPLFPALFSIKPQFGALERIKYASSTRFGKFELGWTKKSGQIRLFIKIPANTSAEITLGRISELKMQDASGSVLAVVSDGITLLRTGSGRYELSFTPDKWQ
ncbi:MAG: alpha-L-rhamnosidase C-terminal domain-containing protein [Oscillospiraceae bacterium]|nr:alpha-L-rhamnosidase C-terminal domain-containing protein [Oscillospiraceae bacterium]